jgi:hypothetical protein
MEVVRTIYYARVNIERGDKVSGLGIVAIGLFIHRSTQRAAVATEAVEAGVVVLHGAHQLLAAVGQVQFHEVFTQHAVGRMAEVVASISGGEVGLGDLLDVGVRVKAGDRNVTFHQGMSPRCAPSPAATRC